MKCIHNIYLKGMSSLLPLLLAFLAIERLTCTVFSNSHCEFSFTDEPCRFSSCRTSTSSESGANPNQTTYYLWDECLSLCCPAGAAEGTDETVDYLTERCGKTRDESLLAVIVGFSIGVPLFIVILICLYCKPWNCIKLRPQEGLEETRGEVGREKIRSVILESNSYSFDGEKKSSTIINFQQREQSKASITCSICLQANTTVKTQCGHHFHLDCLAEWLNKTPNCPDCRTNNLQKFQLLCCRCYRLSRAIGNLDMGPSYTCKWCKIIPN